MSDFDKYIQIFLENFDVNREGVEDMAYRTSEKWDSIAHMNLIAMLEDGFDIEMEMDDIIDFSSFKKGTEILKKYGVKI